MEKSINENIKNFKIKFNCDESFDIVYRSLVINKKKACIFFVDGLIKDDVLEKILEFFYSVSEDKYMENALDFYRNCVPYSEVSLENDDDKIITSVLSGMTALFVDGFEEAILLDLRTYPQRDNGEPDQEKVLRGSKDSFVETIVFNTALIRRRIRDPKLIMKYVSVGSVSKTDVVISYMSDKADMELVKKIYDKISNLKIETLTMTTETLVEGLYKKPWINPFPKVKYTQRPDTAVASVSEGNILILIDNSPSVIILPTSIFDIIEEPDDYYFSPVTGTYLRLSRYLITLVTLLITPLWLLALQYPEKVPEIFNFILIDTNSIKGLSIFWQLIFLEIAIDGLRLASLNTPESLSTSLSVIAAIALSQFAVDAGWFMSETILYMSFVAIANYTQPNFELGYCLKFSRILLLILTELFKVWGFILGLIIVVATVVSNKTLSGKSYIYPIYPLNLKKLKHLLFKIKTNV